MRRVEAAVFDATTKTLAAWAYAEHVAITGREMAVAPEEFTSQRVSEMVRALVSAIMPAIEHYEDYDPIPTLMEMRGAFPGLRTFDEAEDHE